MSMRENVVNDFLHVAATHDHDYAHRTLLHLLDDVANVASRTAYVDGWMDGCKMFLSFIRAGHNPERARQLCDDHLRTQHGEFMRQFLANTTGVGGYDDLS